MRSEGSSVARATSTVRNRLQHVRSEVAKPHHWAALTKCDPDDVLEVNFLANSMLLLRFVTCVEVAFAFCVACRCNTLEACQCDGVFFSWPAQHSVHVHFGISWQAQHFVTCAQCQKSWPGQHFVS